MCGYSIIDNFKLEPHITFIRINPNDITLTLKEVFESLANLSWINSFDDEYLRYSFATRAKLTVKYISENIIKSSDDSITSDSGEYVVSELARKTIVDELKYSDIPLGELIREQKSGNPGFDFYTENLLKIILYGEAKYHHRDNAYGSAFKQILKFEKEERHITDLVDIDRFCSKEALKNTHPNNKKGFIAAFASKGITTEYLIRNIKKNADYQKLCGFEELICVAVNI